MLFCKEHLISGGQQYTTNINKKKRTTTKDTKGNQEKKIQERQTVLACLRLLHLGGA